MKKRKRNVHYVNNRDFLAAIIEYKKQVKEAEENGTDKPRVPKYIGECFIKIANHLSYKPNFVNYCVDELTLVFTKDGWKPYDQVHVNDAVCSYDYNTQELKWSPVKDLYINQNYDGKVYQLTNDKIDLFATQGHKIPTTDGLIAVEKLKNKHKIIIRGGNNICSYKDLKVEVKNYQGLVWCISTEYGSFLSKRNNKICLTGNSYKDEMISDGIENCIQCVLNFDPEKSQNPFAYFTQIITYAFIRRITKEKKQTDIKEKIIERTGFDQVFSDDRSDHENYSEYNSIKDDIYSKNRYF